MSKLWQDIRLKMLHSGSKLGLLIGINVLVFLAITIPGIFEQWFFKSDHITEFADKYLQLPANFGVLLKHFWTPVTYMFMHGGVFHILFNMLWLYWMGQIFEEYLGQKRTVTLYILGGLAGALFFLLAMNLLPLFAGPEWQGVTVIGASAAVMAIIIATATLLPNYEIFLMFLGPVKLKWLALFYVIIDLLGTVGPNAGGEFAHLGGALMGFIYIKQLQRGNDWNKPIDKLFASRSKIKVVPGGASETKKGSPRQEDIDRILDKISQSGYDSLSKQEKETLFRASNK